MIADIPCTNSRRDSSRVTSHLFQNCGKIRLSIRSPMRAGMARSTNKLASRVPIKPAPPRITTELLAFSNEDEEGTLITLTILTSFCSYQPVNRVEWRDLRMAVTWEK